MHFIVFCFYYTSQILHFYKSKVCGNSVWSKPISIIFPTVFAHFVSLCHILVILAIFQTFKLLLYLLWWSSISDLGCFYWTCFGCHESWPYKTAHLINKYFVFRLFYWPAAPLCLSLSTDLLIPWEKIILKLGLLITLK